MSKFAAVSLPLVADDALVLQGASSLVPTKCTPVTGPANADGRCIRGGLEVPVDAHTFRANIEGLNSARCMGTPIFLQTNVPYSSGRIAGTNYAQLSQLSYNTRVKSPL